MKSGEGIMEILEAFDLCRTFRSAAACAVVRPSHQLRQVLDVVERNALRLREEPK